LQAGSIKTVSPKKNPSDKNEADVKSDVQSSAGGSLFNFSNKATVGAGTSLFGGSSNQSGSLFQSGFKFPSTASTGSSSIFQGGSLFGGNTGGSLFGNPTGSSLFGGNTGSSLFSAGAPLFGGQNSLFKPADAKKTEEEEGGSENDGDEDNGNQ
jgi:hypothetical protein